MKSKLSQIGLLPAQTAILAGALDLSKKSPANRGAVFGTAKSPVDYHGTAADETAIQRPSSGYDATTGFIAVNDGRGGTINVTAAEWEVTLKSMVTRANDPTVDR